MNQISTYIFRIILTSFLLIAFLASSYLPDSLFSAKEIGLYLISGTSMIIVFFLWILSKKLFVFHWMDFAIFSLNFLLPLTQASFMSDIALSSVFVQISLTLCYFSIRIITSLVKTVQSVNICIEICVYVLIFNLVIAFLQWTGLLISPYPETIAGMFFNPAPFSINLASLLVLIVPTMRQHLLLGNKGMFCFYSFLSAFCTFFIIISLSRSAWFGFFGSMITVSFLSFINQSPLLDIKKIYRVVAVLVLFACVAIPLVMKTYSFKQDSADGRKLVWLSSLKMIKNSWTIGIGIGNYAGNYPLYQAIALDDDKTALKYSDLAGDVRYAFNDPLQTWAEKGIIGLLLYVIILCGAIWCLMSFIRNNPKRDFMRAFALGLASVILCITFSGLTSYPLQMVPIAVLFWTSVAFSVSLYTAKSSAKPLNSGKWQNTPFFVLLMTAFINIYYGQTRLYAYINWIEWSDSKELVQSKNEKLQKVLLDHPIYLSTLAKNAMKHDKFKIAKNYYNEAIRLSPYPGYYYDLGECYERLNETENALRCYNRVKDAIPNLLRPRYLIARLYHRQQDTTSFLIAAADALEFEPKIINDQVRMMKSDIQKWLMRDVRIESCGSPD